MAKTEIDTLVELLARLPALGPRSARRAVLFLLKKKQTHMEPLIRAFSDVYEKVSTCPLCGNMDTQQPCAICSDPSRNTAEVCVVQDVSDLWAIERSHTFKGVYHVLGGVLSALDGIGPDELNIVSLLGKIKQNNVKEVILALPATVDGQTTAHYLADILEKENVVVSTLSHGVPMGGELDYLDDGTLQTAFKRRHKI